MAVAGFMVTKRGERPSSQGMPTAQPNSTAAEIDIAATAANGSKCAQATMKRVHA